jgi:hypothetical protein
MKMLPFDMRVSVSVILLVASLSFSIVVSHEVGAYSYSQRTTYDKGTNRNDTSIKTNCDNPECGAEMERMINNLPTADKIIKDFFDSAEISNFNP